MRALQCWLLVFSIHLLGFGNSQLYAESTVRNQRDPFVNLVACSHYKNFLSGTVVRHLDKDDCHQLEKFTLTHFDSDIRVLLDLVLKLASPDSALFSIAHTADNIANKDVEGSYASAQIAARRVGQMMASSFDEERAVFYTKLLSDIQNQSVAAMCSSRFRCSDFRTTRKTSDILGTAYETFDSVETGILLTCLLRLDAFTVPIREVVSSPHFRNCALVRG